MSRRHVRSIGLLVGVTAGDLDPPPARVAGQEVRDAVAERDRQQPHPTRAGQPLDGADELGEGFALLPIELRSSAYSLPNRRSTTQQPRVCGPGPRQCTKHVLVRAAGVLEGVAQYGHPSNARSL